MTVQATVNAFFGLFLAAILVEAVVTGINRANDRYRDWRYWVALAFGILVAVVYEIDLFELVGLSAVVPFVGSVLTGVIISRGSNYVSDVVARINNPTGAR